VPLFARHFLAIFLGKLARVFIVVELFLGACSVLAFSATYPYVGWRQQVEVVPDLLLLSMPLCLSFSVLGAGLLAIEEIRRAQGFLAVELAGRDPRWLLWPVLGAGLLGSLACLWLFGSVLPNVEHRLELVATSFVRDAPLLALRAVRDGALFRGFELRFERVDEESVSEIGIVAENRQLAITAKRGAFDVVEDGRTLQLVLTDGRLLRIEPSGELLDDVRFERLTVLIDAERFAGRAKTDLLPLEYYTDVELSRLPDLADLRMHHGLPLLRFQADRLAGIAGLRSARVAASLTPFLELLLVVVFLGMHVERRPGLRAAAVAAGCLVLLVPQQVLVLDAASVDGSTRPWLAWIPTAEVAAILAGAALAHRLASRRSAR
jgi:hypothetical protein